MAVLVFTSPRGPEHGWFLALLPPCPLEVASGVKAEWGGPTAGWRGGAQGDGLGDYVDGDPSKCSRFHCNDTEKGEFPRESVRAARAGHRAGNGPSWEASDNRDPRRPLHLLPWASTVPCRLQMCRAIQLAALPVCSTPRRTRSPATLEWVWRLGVPQTAVMEERQWE